MTFVLATLVYPVLLTLLVVGGGLLADRVSGRFLPLAVMPALGIAVLVGVSQLTTYTSAIAPATPYVMVAVAAAGWWLGRDRLHGLWGRVRATPWPVFAMVGAYLVALAPVLLAGRPSLTLYLTDTTSGTHLAGADFLLHHGRDFSSLDLNTSRGLYLRNYFGTAYPSGGHTLLAGSAELLPFRLTWAFQPYMAFVLAASAGPIWVLLQRIGLRGWWGGVGALVACLPALVYAFDLVGSIKELTALSLILLSGVLVADHERWLKGRWFAAIPFGLVCAGGLSAVGIAFGAWIAVAVAVLVGVLAIDFAAGVRRVKQVLLLAVTVAGTVVVAALPTVINLADSLRATEGIATTTDPGNLVYPLDAAQVFGTWLGLSYLGRPDEATVLTYLVIGITAFAAILGIAHLVRRRLGALFAWFALLGLLWVVLTVKGTTWTDGKMLLLTSPVVALLAWAGVAGLRASRRTFEALVLTAILAAGVLASDALQYHAANLAPTARFDELASIDDRFAGQGPTLLPDFDEYPLYELRNMAPSGVGLAYKPASLASANVPYGHPADLDQVPAEAIAEFPTLVVRRSPTASRPPSTYALAWRGTYYDVWKRRPDAAPVLARQSGDSGPLSATGPVRCQDVRALSRVARKAGGQLAVATRPAVVGVSAFDMQHTPGFVDSGQDSLNLVTPGELGTTLTVPHAGRWNVWIEGQLARPVTVYVDGRRIGSVGEQTAGLENFVTPLPVTLTAGRHQVAIVRGGGGLAPGDLAPSSIGAVVLAPVAGQDGRVETVAPRDWRSLCGRDVDWIEAVGPTP